MGKLAFAPATPEVLKLAAHLHSSHELFADVFHGVFRWVTAKLSLRIEVSCHERCTTARLPTPSMLLEHSGFQRLLP